MWRQVGLVRTRDGLHEAVARLSEWRCALAGGDVASHGDVERLRTARLVTVGLLIAHAALRREESRGGHFRTDFPARDDSRWRRHIADVRQPLS